MSFGGLQGPRERHVNTSARISFHINPTNPHHYAEYTIAYDVKVLGPGKAHQCRGRRQGGREACSTKSSFDVSRCNFLSCAKAFCIPGVTSFRASKMAGEFRVVAKGGGEHFCLLWYELTPAGCEVGRQQG